MRHWLLFTTLLGLGSCARSPDSYPTPAQYVMPPGPEPPAPPVRRRQPVLAMAEPDVNAHILQDVIEEPDGQDWRWTRQHPKFSLSLKNAGNLNFYMRFAIVQETWRDTGPVTLTIRVNDQILDRPRFEKPGDFEYRRPAPADMLAARNPVVIAVDVDPPWTAPGGGKLGIYLHSIGFEKRPP